MSDRPILFSAPMIKALIAGRKTQTRRLLKDEVPPSPGIDAWLRVSLGKTVEAPKHPAPYLDAYCNAPRTKDNPRAMSTNWCWWTRDDRQCLPTFRVPFAPGHRLWVKETFLPDPPADHDSWDDEGIETYVSWSGTGGPLSNIPKALRKPKHVLYRATWKTQHEWQWRPSLFMPRWASRITLTVTDVRVQRLQDISEDDAQAEGVRPVPGQPDPPGAYRVAYHELWNTLHNKRGAFWEDNPWVSAVSFRCELRNIDVLSVSEEHAARAAALEPM